MYGDFFQLTTAIKEYLAAGNPGELFVKILDRMEDDFEQRLVERYYVRTEVSFKCPCITSIGVNVLSRPQLKRTATQFSLFYLLPLLIGTLSLYI